MYNVQKRVVEMWINNGSLLSHKSLDVDALFSIWIVYYFISNIFNIAIEQFVNKIKLVSAADRAFYPDFGVDIFVKYNDDNIKQCDFPIAINGNIYAQPCASMALASTLLCEKDFRALKDLIAEIHDVDTTGTTANKEQMRPVVSLWGILGAIQDNSNILITIKTIDTIFRSILMQSSDTRENALISLKEVEVIIAKDQYTIAIAPLNGGRSVSEKCFHELYANVVIWSSFDDISKTGTVGISVSRKFSQKFNLETIKEFPEIKNILEEINDMYFSPHICGRTTKSPIENTTQENILKYRSVLLKAIKRLVGEKI